MGGSSSTTRIDAMLPGIGAPTLGLLPLQFLDRQADREDGPAATHPISGMNRAALRLDEASADREPKPGPGALPIATPHPIELVEDALQVLVRNARSLVAHFDDDAAFCGVGVDFDCRPLRGVLGGVVEQIDEHLFGQDEV